VQADFAKMLSERPSLKELNLRFFRIMEQSLLATICSSTIERMSLAIISDRGGMEEIANAIENMPSLRKLQIGFKHGGGGFAIKSVSLQELYLLGVGRPTVNELACPSLRNLTIGFDDNDKFVVFRPSILRGCSQTLDSFTLRIGQFEHSADWAAFLADKGEDFCQAIEQMPKLKNLHLTCLGILQPNSNHETHVFELNLRSRYLQSINFRGSRRMIQIIECRCPMLILIQYDYYLHNGQMETQGLLQLDLNDKDVRMIEEEGYADLRVGDRASYAYEVPDNCIVRFHRKK